MGLRDLFVRSRLSDKTRIEPYNVETWFYRSFKGEMVNDSEVRACIDALARNIAKMTLESVRVDANNKKEIDRNSDVARVLRKPNNYMTSYDFLYKVASMYFISNNVFIWKEYDKNANLVGLHPILYKNLKLVRTETGHVFVKFSINYTTEYVVPYEEVIHLRNHFMTDDLFGDSNGAIKAGVELLNAQNQGIINGIKNSAIIRGILKAVGVIKETDLVKARDRFVKDNLSASNNGGVVVVDSKFDYTPIESHPYVVDSNSMREAKNKIHNYFGVNEDFLQNRFESKDYEAVYEGRLEPFAIMLSQAFTHGLFTDRERGFGNEIQANMSKVKYQSLGTVVAVINATCQLGLFKRDEYREMLGYAPLGAENGGDEIMIAINNYQADGGKDESNEQEGN